MIKSMNDDTQKAQVMWFKEPETLAEFDIEQWRNAPRLSKRTITMCFLHMAMYEFKAPHCDFTRQTVRQYLCEFPEFVEEVLQVRPELLEM